MSTFTRDLTAAQVADNEQATFGLYGGTVLGDASESDLQKGFTRQVLDDAGERKDDDGTNYVGNPYSRDGFLDPGLGYSR